MGVFLFIELEHEISDLDDDLDGKAWAQGDVPLDEIAGRIGLKTIADMTSCSSEQLADLMGDDPNVDLSGFEEGWFEPAEGRLTVRGLVDHLEAHPSEMSGWRYPEYVLEDLRAALGIFDAACEAGVRFHFTWAV